ncbi:MAG: Ig-like domain-containing protein [Lachnospiraceae bacterium]|nr:Ig-like domain-containing protein [Lachnospiraceae bacterium]
MATGIDKNYNVPTEVKPGYGIQDKDIITISPLKKYNNKVFPTYYQDYASGADKGAVSPGYSENETNASNKVGFQQNTLEFDTTKIADAWISGDDTTTPLLDRNQIDMVLGATYKGSQGLAASDYHMVLYLDDIQVMSGDIVCKSMKFVNPPKKLACGDGEIKPGRATLEISYEPVNTTQREVTYTSSDTSLATVDANGIVTANNDGKTGNVTITATNKANSNTKAETTIEIEKLTPATEDYDILANATIVAKSDDEKVKVKSNTDNLKLENGQLAINYDSANQSVVLDLGQEMNLNRYKGIELTGNMPGQLAVEFYGAGFDMTQTKDNGAEKDWWETMSGKTFPFYNGSSSQRTEAGGMTKSVLEAKGFINSDGKATADDETLRYSLQKLADGSTGDWSAIRYVVVKSNNEPYLPYGAFDSSDKKENRKTYLYTLKAFKLTAREVYDCDDANRYTIVTDKAENMAAESGTAKAYYVDNVSTDNPVDKHNAQKDLQDFKFIKVVVEGAAEVKVGLLKDGQTIGDYVAVGQSTGTTGEKAVYYRIDSLGADVDIHNVDSIVVDLPQGGTLSKLQLVQGEIAYIGGKNDPAQYDLVDGVETEVTEAAYGKN